MKLKRSSRLWILTSVLVVVITVFLAQFAIRIRVTASVAAYPYDLVNGGIIQYYACTRGNVASACASLYGSNNPQTASANDFEMGGLEQFYACTRGNVASACASLYGSNNPQTASANDFEMGGLEQFYACTRGNVASACASLYGT